MLSLSLSLSPLWNQGCSCFCARKQIQWHEEEYLHFESWSTRKETLRICPESKNPFSTAKCFHAHISKSQIFHFDYWGEHNRCSPKLPMQRSQNVLSLGAPLDFWKGEMSTMPKWLLWDVEPNLKWLLRDMEPNAILPSPHCKTTAWQPYWIHAIFRVWPLGSLS